MLLLGEGSEATEPYNKYYKIRRHSIRSLQFDQKVRLLSFRPEKIDLFTATRVKAIVYTKKFGTKELFEVIWKSTGILTINIRTHLLSKRKQNSNRYKHQLLENHLEVEIEGSLMKIVFDLRKNLRRLTLKKKDLKHANGPPKNALEVKDETGKG